MPHNRRSFSGQGCKRLSIERSPSFQEHETPLIPVSTPPGGEIPIPFPTTLGSHGDDQLLNSTGPRDGDECSSQPDSDAPLSLCQKLCYGMGGPPMQLVSNCMAFFFTIFLLETAGVDAYYNSVIQFSARIWDAITDPIVGYLVTKTKTRWGRLRPWLLLSAPFGCVGFFLIFYVPQFESMGARFAFYLICVLVLQTSLTTFHVPYSSMTMVLTANVRDRDLCSAFRMGFELIGLLLGVAVFGSIIGHYRIANACIENTGDSGNGTIASYPLVINESARYMERVSYMAGSSVISFLFLLCTLIVFFGTTERDIMLERKENYLRSLKKILTFQPYIRLMFAFLFCSLGLQTIQGNLSLYVTHSLKLPNHMIYGILTVLVMAVVCIPLAQLLISKFGKKIAFASGLIAMMPVQVILVVIPPQPHLAVYYLIMAISGYTISVAFLLPWSMLPDAIDAFTLKYGVRKEAAFYSFYVFFNKFAVGISVGASSFILGLVGYETKACTQSDEVAQALRYLMGPTSMVCFIISLVCLYLYPINEKYRLEVKNKLMKIRSDRDLMEKSCATIASTLGGANCLTDSHLVQTSNFSSTLPGVAVVANGNGIVSDHADLEDGTIVITCNGSSNSSPSPLSPAHA